MTNPFLYNTFENFFWTHDTISLIDNNNLTNINNIVDNHIINEFNKVQNIAPKNTFTKYSLQFIRTSLWKANSLHPYFKIYNINSPPLIHLNTFNNIVILGDTIDNKKITTSIVKYITDDWCYTISGNVYKLQNKVSLFDYLLTK